MAWKIKSSSLLHRLAVRWILLRSISKGQKQERKHRYTILGNLANGHNNQKVKWDETATSKSSARVKSDVRKRIINHASQVLSIRSNVLLGYSQWYTQKSSFDLSTWMPHQKLKSIIFFNFSPMVYLETSIPPHNVSLQ